MAVKKPYTFTILVISSLLNLAISGIRFHLMLKKPIIKHVSKCPSTRAVDVQTLDAMLTVVAVEISGAAVFQGNDDLLTGFGDPCNITTMDDDIIEGSPNYNCVADLHSTSSHLNDLLPNAK
jgi:hypothetical protein